MFDKKTIRALFFTLFYSNDLFTVNAYLCGKTSTALLHKINSIRNCYHSRSPILTKALIYSWEDEENTKEDNNNGLLMWDEKPIEKGLDLHDAKIIVEHLAKDESRVSSLARLAVAFSPPERRINLKDIEKIEILSVDGDHIEILAAVRHEEACVRLLVPVQFPNSCGGVIDVEECVLDNIDTLDRDAEHRIEEQLIADEIFDLNYYLDDSNLNEVTELPSWWVQPHESSVIQECDTVKELLNDAEFQNEVKALAMRALHSADSENQIIVERAIVTDVGPSGLCFRARARYLDEGDDESENKLMLEIPYKFSSNAIDASALRAAVLGAVAEVSL